MNEKPNFDPVLTAVIANRLDGIIREMTNSLLRAARSAVINNGRDFSCALVSADNELLACAEGLPVHIFGVNVQTAYMMQTHPVLREGDAFLHNDPYSGNTHPADHTFLVPVFFEGEHLFTAAVKAHQADLGNSIPTAYHAAAKDIYAEGALIFPAVQIQRDYQMIDDIVRMCQSRIRVPGQWYGDFLAGIGAARIAERRLKELCAKYGVSVLKRFMTDWLDYSEQRMANAIKALPKARLENTGHHDAFAPFLPNGLTIKVSLDIDPDEGRISVDLRDNAPSLDCGLNVSESASASGVLAGVFNSIEADIPKNSGAFRRVTFLVKDDTAVGRPAFPHSCSVSTTNVTDRLVNATGAAFAQLGQGFGLAEGGVGLGPGYAVLSGEDWRYDNEQYVNQLVLSSPGGPGSPLADGWVTYGIPVVSGLMYRDSVEIDELKHPIEVQYLRLMKDTGGAGQFRGAPSCELAYVAKEHDVTVIYPCDGQVTPPRGVRGGQDGKTAEAWKIGTDGTVERLPSIAHIALRKGEAVRGVDCSGGGYGSPLERDPQRVLHDVMEGWESCERAEAVYGVKLTQADQIGDLSIDFTGTEALRRQLLSLAH